MPPTVPEDQKQILAEKCFTEGTESLWANLEKKLPEQGWICGDKMTWIDIALGCFLYSGPLNPANKRAALWGPAWEKASAKTKAYAERFGEEFKEYLANR